MEKIREIVEKKEAAIGEILEIVRLEAWMEDTGFEAVPAEGGGYHIEEHVWSMNSEHVRVLATIGSDGKIKSTGGLKGLESLKAAEVVVK